MNFVVFAIIENLERRGMNYNPHALYAMKGILELIESVPTTTAEVAVNVNPLAQPPNLQPRTVSLVTALTSDDEPAR